MNKDSNEKLVEAEEVVRDHDIEKKLSNKQVRYALYRGSIEFIHGHLGKGRRIELPICVRGEILDIAPDPDHEYTGFREAGN